MGRGGRRRGSVVCVSCKHLRILFVLLVSWSDAKQRDSIEHRPATNQTRTSDQEKKTPETQKERKEKRITHTRLPPPPHTLPHILNQPLGLHHGRNHKIRRPPSLSLLLLSSYLQPCELERLFFSPCQPSPITPFLSHPPPFPFSIEGDRGNEKKRTLWLFTCARNPTPSAEQVSSMAAQFWVALPRSRIKEGTGRRGEVRGRVV